MTDVLNVKNRTELGTSACRRLRQRGLIPAVMYGHGEGSINLTVSESELAAAIRQGSKLLEIKGDVNDSALLKEIQWDAMGIEVLHLDLTRVDADETVEVAVNIELRGEAPGSKEGGIVEHLTHELELLCRAKSIPDSLEVNINQLHLNESIVASELELPPGAKMTGDPDAVIVQCTEPQETEEIEGELELGESAEPEVIGRDADDEEEGESE